MPLTPEQINNFRGKYNIEPTEAPTPANQNSISSAFQSGISQVKQGYFQGQQATNPIELLRGGTKLAAGAVNTLYSPLAPLFSMIGKGTEAVSEKISDVPAVQDFAQTKAGQVLATLSEDVLDVATIAGGVAGVKATPQIGSAIGKGVKPVLGATGRVLKETGKGSYGITITPEEGTTMAVQRYEANQGTLFNRVKNIVKGENLEGGPITEAETAARKGLMGTEWRLGVQAKQITDDLWKNTISPRLNSIKEKVNMRSFFDEMEKDIRKETPELSRRNAELEALQALREEFKNVGDISLPKLQGYKEGWAEQIPEATYKGKPIGSTLKDVKNRASEKARQIIYSTAGKDIQQAYIDYGNLKSIMKSGVKSKKDPASRGVTRNIWEFIMNKAVTPIVTTGGKVLYRTGEGLEFLGSPGARTVREVIDDIPNKQGGFIKTPLGQGEIPKTIPKDLEPLAVEARKYKSAEEFVKKSKPTTISKETSEWLDIMTKPRGFDDIKLSRPSVNMEYELLSYKPSKSVKLFRGTNEAQETSRPNTGLESWTYDKNIAKDFGNVVEKEFSPDEIFLDTTKLPEGLRGKFPEEGEVFIKRKDFKSQLTDFYNKAVGKKQ